MATYTFFGQLRQSKKKESSAPIGLNSLSKTFNIIQVVGQSTLKLFVYVFEKERMGTVYQIQPLGRLSTLLVLVSVHSLVGLECNQFELN